MKYLPMIVRNVLRNPARSATTIASIAVSLFLTMFITSYVVINDSVINSVRVYDRLVTMRSFGFSGRIPIACVAEISRMKGVVAATPFFWFGGKYQGKPGAFAQYAVSPETGVTIFEELSIAPAELEAFRAEKTACVIGRKLAEDLNSKIGDPLPIEGGPWPVNLDLTIRGIYDGPANRNLRMCVVRWDYVDELLKSTAPKMSGNAGANITKCTGASAQAELALAIDALYANSDTPARTQTEEAFGRMFAESVGDARGLIRKIGFAEVFALLCMTGNAIAMSTRERAHEIAVLKAIGFARSTIVLLTVGEAVFVAVLGGAIGTLGCKTVCDFVDIARLSGGGVPYFFVNWSTVAAGMAISLAVGFASSIVPAMLSARRTVIDGLRKVD